MSAVSHLFAASSEPEHVFCIGDHGTAVESVIRHVFGQQE